LTRSNRRHYDNDMTTSEEEDDSIDDNDDDDTTDAAATAGAAMHTTYLDAKRQVSLVYPGETGRVIDRLLIDAFADALDDRDLRIRILMEEPKTLDEALNIGLRVVALRPSGMTGQPIVPPAIDDYGCDDDNRHSAFEEAWKEMTVQDYADHSDAPTLGLYDGKTPVEAHLAEFEKFARASNWGEEERIFGLGGSLVGMASTVLYNEENWESSAALILALMDMFGVGGRVEMHPPRATTPTGPRSAGEPRRLFETTEPIGEPPPLVLDRQAQGTVCQVELMVWEALARVMQENIPAEEKEMYRVSAYNMVNKYRSERHYYLGEPYVEVVLQGEIPEETV